MNVFDIVTERIIESLEQGVIPWQREWVTSGEGTAYNFFSGRQYSLRVWEVNGIRYRIRIRKLTPRECWRLMGFSDRDFNFAQKVNSNTQLYKQAGNSIVEDVLKSIFSQMLEK